MALMAQHPLRFALGKPLELVVGLRARRGIDQSRTQESAVLDEEPIFWPGVNVLVCDADMARNLDVKAAFFASFADGGLFRRFEVALAAAWKEHADRCAHYSHLAMLISQYDVRAGARNVILAGYSRTKLPDAIVNRHGLRNAA
jgi:hypothetical protein